MNLYYISYNHHTNTIKYETIDAHLTEKSVCWLGRRLPRNEIGLIHTNYSYNPYVSVYVYSTTLDIMPMFKQQVAIAQKLARERIMFYLDTINHNIDTFNNQYGVQDTSYPYQAQRSFYEDDLKELNKPIETNEEVIIDDDDDI